MFEKGRKWVICVSGVARCSFRRESHSLGVVYVLRARWCAATVVEWGIFVFASPLKINLIGVVRRKTHSSQPGCMWMACMLERMPELKQNPALSSFLSFSQFTSAQLRPSAVPRWHNECGDAKNTNAQMERVLYCTRLWHMLLEWLLMLLLPFGAEREELACPLTPAKRKYDLF